MVEPSHSRIEKVNTSLLKGIRKTENLYKVAKVDVILNGGSPTSNAPRTSTIAVAKLLNNIEKSYDFGKKVLEESKKNENLSEYSRFILNIDDIISKKGVVVEPVADYDNADLGGAGLQYRIIADNKVIGFIPLEAYYDFKTKQPDFLDKKVSVVNFGWGSELKPEYRGQGYGKAAYLAVAKELAKSEHILPYNGYLVDFYKSKTDEGKIKVVFMKTVRHCIHDYIVNMYSFIQYSCPHVIHEYVYTL